MDARLKDISEYIAATTDIQRQTAAACADQIVEAVDIVVRAFLGGGKVLLCGNGGSAADCQHIAAEFTGRLSRPRSPLAAIALTTDSSVITAQANDEGFENVFSRQVEALGREGDVLIGISTSGRSENVRRAMTAARAQRMRTIALVGLGGPLATEAEHAIVIPNADTQHIQEAMLPVEHLICLLAEKAMFP